MSEDWQGISKSQVNQGLNRRIGQMLFGTLEQRSVQAVEFTPQFALGGETEPVN